MRYSDDIIEEVRMKNDIVDVVSQYVKLNKRGSTYFGLCPFHNEKSPSFSVSPGKQMYYCFGCGAGGNVITFLMEYENQTFPEAVRTLAQRAGIALPEADDSKEARQADSRRAKLLEINKEAAKYFYYMLRDPRGEVGMRYLTGRKLTDETMHHFGLGYAGKNGEQVVQYLRKKGFTDEEIKDSGLAMFSEQRGLRSQFWNRVMFPIQDINHRVIGFGGRVMGDGEPKYLNSPETMIFDKRRNLYGLNFARTARTGNIILCEGYMDVIAMHEAGFDTAVCACGTALTAEQAKLLSEYADEVVLSYDSDEAGQKATERSLGIMANTPMKVSVLSYQGAKDPDEFIKKYGRERFEMLLNGTANPTEFQLKKAKAKYDLRSDDGRLSYIREAIGILTERGVSPTARDVYAGRLADETGVSKQAIVSQMQGAVQTAARRDRRRQQQELSKQGIAADIRVPYTSSGESALGAAAAARQLAAALMQNPDEIPYVRRRLDMATVLVPELQSVLQAIFQCADSGQPLNLTTLQQMLDDKAFQQIALAMAQNHDAPLQHQDIDMYLDRLENARPLDEKVRQMDDSQFSDFFANMGKKKGAKAEEPEE